MTDKGGGEKLLYGLGTKVSTKIVGKAVNVLFIERDGSVLSLSTGSMGTATPRVAHEGD